MKPNYKILEIDPSIGIKIDLEEIINTALIKIQSYSSNDDVIVNLYEVLSTYLKQEHVERIYSASFRKERLIEIKRLYNLKKLLDDDEEETTS